MSDIIIHKAETNYDDIDFMCDVNYWDSDVVLSFFWKRVTCKECLKKRRGDDE